MIRAGLGQGEWLLVGVSIAVSLFTLLSMLKIWHYAFLQAHPNPKRDLQQVWMDLGQKRIYLLLPILCLAGLNLSMGLFAEFFLNLTGQFAEELIHPTAYIEAVQRGGL